MIFCIPSVWAFTMARCNLWLASVNAHTDLPLTPYMYVLQGHLQQCLMSGLYNWPQEY